MCCLPLNCGSFSSISFAGIVSLYILYVIVVVVGRYIYQKHKKRRGQDIASPIAKPGHSGKELIEGQHKQSQDEVYIRQALTLSSDSESGVDVRQASLNQTGAQSDLESQLLESGRDREDVETARAVASREPDTISVTSDITSDVTDASGHFSSHAASRVASPRLTRRRSSSLPPVASPSNFDATLVKRLHQRRRPLRIKRLSYGIASLWLCSRLSKLCADFVCLIRRTRHW